MQSVPDVEAGTQEAYGPYIPGQARREREAAWRRAHPPEPEVTIQGGCMGYNTHEGGTASGHGGGRRAIITGMSDASRRRLMQLFASLEWDLIQEQGIGAHFLTLTSAPEHWGDFGLLHDALERLRKRFVRAWGEHFSVWRMEQGALHGMLHFHIVLFGWNGDTGILAGWLHDNWGDCVGRSCLRVDAVDVVSAEQLAKYVCKYAAKTAYSGRMDVTPTGASPADLRRAGLLVGGAEGLLLFKSQSSPQESQDGAYGDVTPCGTGRWWGCWARRLMPVGERERVDIPLQEVKAVAAATRRVFRAWFERNLTSQLLWNQIEKASKRCMSVAQYRAWVKQEVKRRARWLRNAGGWVIMGSRAVLDLCLYAGCYATQQ